MNNPRFIMVWLLLCFTHSVCTPSVSNECKNFFSLSLDQRGEVFPSYPLDTQLRIYRCGLNRRPPATHLAVYIAAKGEAAIPTLLEKLEGERDELFQYGIIDVFQVMSVRGYLRSRSDVLKRIRQVIGQMKIPTFRKMSEKALREIEHNSSG
jgi:hypothetical protein